VKASGKGRFSTFLYDRSPRISRRPGSTSSRVGPRSRTSSTGRTSSPSCATPAHLRGDRPPGSAKLPGDRPEVRHQALDDAFRARRDAHCARSRGAPGGSYEEFVLDAIEPRGRLDEFAAVEMLPIVDENANAAPREGQIGAICANQQSLAALGGGRRACQLSLGFTKFTAWLNRPVPWLTARTSTRMSASTLGRVGVRP